MSKHPPSEARRRGLPAEKAVGEVRIRAGEAGGEADGAQQGGRLLDQTRRQGIVEGRPAARRILAGAILILLLTLKYLIAVYLSEYHSPVATACFQEPLGTIHYKKSAGVLFFSASYGCFDGKL